MVGRQNNPASAACALGPYPPCPVDKHTIAGGPAFFIGAEQPCEAAVLAGEAVMWNR